MFALFVQRTGNLGSLDSITGQSTDRGYTMHEHLDEMGVIHMNGRIYDPLVGRFMSADPFIQSPDDLQSYNRFIYVMNNPLAFTDPSGYFSLGGFLRAGLNYLVAPTIQNSFQFFAAQPGQKQVDQFVMSNPTAYAVGKIATSAFTTFCGGCGGAIYSAYYAYQGTGSVTEAAKAGAITYGTAAAFNWAGGQGEAGSPERYAAHAGVGCLSAVASGASCGAGAASAVFGKFATNNIKFGGDVANGVAAAVAGGVGSVIAGGKFENGAVTAAFGYLFNYLGALTRGAQLIQQTWGRFQSLVGSPLGQVLTEVAASEVNSGSIVGKSYGQLGRVVESFSGEMQGISNIHFVDRAIERGVSPTQILDTLRVPQVVLEQRGGGHIFITNEAAVVLNKSNQLVTTYGKAEFQKDVRSVLNEKLLLQIPK